MNVNPASRALAACIEDWWGRVRPGSGDCRVVVPAPTVQMGLGVHQCLLQRDIPSYLVVSGKNGSLVPSAQLRVLRAEAVTSVRDGSFAVVVEPGELSKLQESIQGSGGGIRGLAIPDEWPWVGSYPGFDFFDDFFPRWIEFSGFPEAETKLASSLLHIAIRELEAVHQRTQILFDEILARSFHGHADTGGSVDVLARVIGVPSFAGPSEKGGGISVEDLRMISDVKAIAEAMQGSNARIAIEQNAAKTFQRLLPEDRPGSVCEFRALLDAFLDRMRRGVKSGRGALALRAALPDSLSEWRMLTLPVLRSVFVEEATVGQVAIDAQWNESSSACLLSGGHHCIMSTRDEIPEILVQVDRPEGMGVQIEAKAGRSRIAEIGMPPGVRSGELGISPEKIKESAVITVSAFMQDAARVACKLHIERPSNADNCFLVVAESTRDGSAVRSLRRIEGAEEHEGHEEPSIDFDEGTSLYFVSLGGCPSVFLDGVEVEFDEVAHGVFRLHVDVGALARLAAQPVLTCSSGCSSVVVPISLKHRKGGACNLEIALAEAVERGSNAVPKLLRAWDADEDARALLGAPSEVHEKRFGVVREAFEREEDGWKPVLAPQGVGLLANIVEQGFVRVARAHSNLSIAKAIEALIPSPVTQALLDEYANARREVLALIKNRHGKRARAGLPLYAVASFHYEPGDELDVAVRNFLGVFAKVQEAIAYGKGGLGWAERFLLAHVDTVVLCQEDSSGWFPSGCAIGPWHPLVVAKRLMVGRGIRRLAKINDRGARYWLRRLVGLLHGVTGFRWFSVILPHSTQPVPCFVEATDDPGWLIAHPEPDAAAGRSLREIARQAACLGLTIEGGDLVDNKEIKGYLADFLRAFPSRRSIVMKIDSEVAAADVALAAREFLGEEDELTQEGRILNGGVHILVDGDGGDSGSYPEWARPVVCVYPGGGKGFRYSHKIDLNLCHAANAISFPVRADSHAPRRGARGTGVAAVLQLPFRILEDTANQVRDTRLSYDTEAAIGQDELGSSFVNAVRSAQLAASPSREVGVRTLPTQIESTKAVWTIVPGDGVDPAVLLDWTRRSMDDGVPRLLWDYRMSLARTGQSYFVISEVPDMLIQRVAGSSVFRDRQRAGRALLELGQIGLALGSETFKSRSRALGVIGLVGAARVAQQVLDGVRGEDNSCHGFLLPIDSFADLLGGNLDEKGSDSDSRRADLVGVICRVKSGLVELGFLSVESKYCAGTYGPERARAALGQARRSLERLNELAKAANEADALAERLAFARLLEFGLRLDVRHCPEFVRDVVASVLSGKHMVGALGERGCMVVATEVGASDSECIVLDEGMWVRLSPSNWPGEGGDIRPLIEELACHFKPSWEARLSALGNGLGVNSRQDFGGKEANDSEEGGTTLLPRSKPEDRYQVARSVGGSEVGGEPNEESNGRSHDEPRAEASRAGLGVYAEKAVAGPPQLAAKEDFRFMLGVDGFGNPVEWRAGVNANHNFMVTGTSGTGKTQLLKGILWQARKQGLPALIMDFKNDFAPDRAFCRNARLDVQFVAYQGLPFNPLIPCGQILPHTGRVGYPISQHVNGIVSAFQRAYGLGEQQAADLKAAIRRAFDEAGMPSSSVVHELPGAFPDFSSVGRHLREINRLAYNRLDPIFDLEVFRDEYREIEFSSLLGRGCVLDLSAIQSAQIQNTLAMLLVYSAHRYLNALGHAPTIKQLLVFDEAHRVRESKEVEELVRECRAYGVGVVLSSQFPTDFSPDTATNLASKVIYGNGPDQARIQAIRQMLGLPSDVDEKLDMPVFHAVIKARPGPACFARTIGFPHWLVLEALEAGPLLVEDFRKVEGLLPDHAPAIIQHLAAMGLVEVDDGVVKRMR